MGLLLLAAGVAAGEWLIWGSIGPRYLADFVPLLALGSGVGLAVIWRRQDGHSRKRRSLVTGLSIVINTGVAITPAEQCSTPRVRAFVQSDTLPAWAPADQLRIIGNSDAPSISNGEDYSTDPVAAAKKQTWQVVEYGPGLQRTFYVTPQASTTTTAVPLVRAGSWTVEARAVPQAGGKTVLLDFPVVGGSHADRIIESIPAQEPVGGAHRVVVLTDPYTHLVEVTIDGLVVTKAPLVGGLPVTTAVPSGQASATTGITVVDGTAGGPQPTLCQSLKH
jgi:hypothetical protein